MKKWLFALVLTGCTIDIPELPDRAEKSGEMSLLDKKKGWSANGLLTLGSAQPEISMQADFDEPGPYTLQFDVQYPAESNPLAPEYFEGFPAAQARIFWSVEGNSVERLVTLTPGASISGVGQGVSVKVSDLSTFTTAPTVTVQYPVGIQVVKGPRSAIQPPFYFRSSDRRRLVAPVAAGLQFGDTVPEKGGITSCRVFAGFAGGPGIEDGIVEMGFSVKNTVVAPFQYAVVLDPQKQGLIPIPPGATSYYLRLRSVPVGSGDFYWNILWGVDG